MTRTTNCTKIKEREAMSVEDYGLLEICREGG